MFKHVKKVPPGHVLTIRSGGITEKAFHTFNFPEVTKSQGEADWARELNESLFRAVRRQMISDVPVGLFLSGGVDSGGLLAIASSFNAEPLKTFTIGFRREDQRFEGQPDDVRYARELSRIFKTDHREIILEPKIVDLLPKVIWHLDDPIADPAAIASYLICQAARERDTKVLLSGQGGDEVFCGYPWHLAMQLSRSYHRLPRAVREVLTRVLSMLPGAKGGAFTGTFRRLRKFNASASLGFEERLIGFLSYAYPDSLAGLLGERFAGMIENRRAEQKHREALMQSRDWHYINRMLHLDMETFLPSLNLAYTDKTSMAFGVEVRVPYIDNEIVEFMTQVPPELKMRGTTRKHLLKQALADLLPTHILHRKKGGFGAPIRTWIVSDLREMIGDLLSDSNLKRRGVFNPAYVQKLIRENAAGRHDHSYLIYILLSFEIWCRVYLDNPPSQTAREAEKPCLLFS